MPRTIDITGQRFGWLVAIELSYINARHQAQWLCRCDCGKLHVAQLGRLRYGDTKSCGCQHYKNFHRISHGRTRGGNHPVYTIWIDMRRRCNNPNHPAFKNYGARGIKVCERWDKSFTDFLTDVGERPDGLTIDRKDNDGNYEPGNVRWATRKEQNNNQRHRNRWS